MGFDRPRSELNYNGALWSPALVGASDPTTGVFVRSNEVGLVIAGTLIASARSFGFAPSGPLAAADGTVSAPSISFASDPDSGFYSFGANQIAMTLGGQSTVHWWNNGTYDIRHNSALFRMGTSTDVILARDAAATLALKNADVAQEFRVYGAVTGPKYVYVTHNGTNAIINTSAASGSLILGGTANAMIGTGANLLFQTDNASDIGAAGATRPRNVFIAGYQIVGGALTLGGQFSINGAASANSNVQLTKSLTAMANATATTIATVTVPNAIHTGNVQVTVTGGLGDGDSTHTVTYNIAISRIAGAATKAVVSSAVGSAATVGATATATTAVTVTSMSGAVGATQTFDIQVAVSRSAGASTNHRATAELKLLNALATGITIA